MSYPSWWDDDDDDLDDDEGFEAMVQPPAGVFDPGPVVIRTTLPHARPATLSTQGGGSADSPAARQRRAAQELIALAGVKVKKRPKSRGKTLGTHLPAPAGERAGVELATLAGAPGRTTRRRAAAPAEYDPYAWWETPGDQLIALTRTPHYERGSSVP